MICWTGQHRWTAEFGDPRQFSQVSMETRATKLAARNVSSRVRLRCYRMTRLTFVDMPLRRLLVKQGEAPECLLLGARLGARSDSEGVLIC